MIFLNWKFWLLLSLHSNVLHGVGRKMKKGEVVAASVRAMLQLGDYWFHFASLLSAF